MELTKSHGAVLVKIHDSENENLKKSRFVEVKSTYPDLEEIIEELEKFELVEYEIRENTYYLTTEGYEIVEKIKNPPKVKKINKKSNEEEYNDMVKFFGGAKNFHRFVILIMLIVGVMFALMFYMDSTRL